MPLHKAFEPPRKQQKTSEEQECPTTTEELDISDPFQVAVLDLLERILEALAEPTESDEEDWE